MLPESQSPFFILDNGLNPQMSRMLASLGYPIRSVQDQFNISPQDSVEDPDIIDHIADYYDFRGVLINKDISAKRRHLPQIRERGISVIWINKQDLNVRQQLRIIMYGFDGFVQDLVESDRPIHYQVAFHGLPNRERISYKAEPQARRRRS